MLKPCPLYPLYLLLSLSPGSPGLYGPDRCKSVVCPRNSACKLFPDFIPVCACPTAGQFYDSKLGSCFPSEWALALSSGLGPLGLDR